MDEHKTKQAPFRGAIVTSKRALSVVVVVVGSFTTVTAQAQECVPSCRDGYVCHQGECIVACNPPCAAGETCVADGQCVAAASSAPASSSSAQPAAYALSDTSEKPSVAIPATFVGLGGFLMIAGGVVFATGEWSGYYGDYWGGGQYAGVTLMSFGALSIVTATPFLVRQVKAKKRWKRERASAFGRDLTLAPVLAPTPRNRMYGLTLCGRF